MTKEKNDHVHLLSGYILYHEKIISIHSGVV